LDPLQAPEGGDRAHRGAPAAVRAVAERRAERVAVHDADVLNGHSELRGDHLGESRLVPLAVRLGAGRDDHLAREMNADVRAFPEPGAPALAARANPGRRCDSAHLDVAGEADPEVAPVPPRVLLL